MNVQTVLIDVRYATEQIKLARQMLSPALRDAALDSALTALERIEFSALGDTQDLPDLVEISGSGDA